MVKVNHLSVKLLQPPIWRDEPRAGPAEKIRHPSLRPAVKKPVEVFQSVLGRGVLLQGLQAQSHLPTFWEAEELCTTPSKLCTKCKACQECSFRGQQITREEAEVVRRQEQKMKVDQVEKCIHLEYVWTEDVNQLRDNIGQVIPIQASLEKRLTKDGMLPAYNAELRKAIESGAVVELTKDEVRRWTGPVSYCAHHAVYKPDSPSTPLRIVVN